MEMPSLIIGRFLAAGSVVNSTIVVVGGQSSFGASGFTGAPPGVYVNLVEAFDTTRPDEGWRELPPLPGFGRESIAVAAIGQRLYLFGGFYVNYAEAEEDLSPHRRHCGDACVFDLRTLRWRRLPDLPFPAVSHPISRFWSSKQERRATACWQQRSHDISHLPKSDNSPWMPPGGTSHKRATVWPPSVAWWAGNSIFAATKSSTRPTSPTKCWSEPSWKADSLSNLRSQRRETSGSCFRSVLCPNQLDQCGSPAALLRRGISKVENAGMLS